MGLGETREGGAQMIQSMTGYSRAAKRLARGSVTAELRSTNHRFLEISQRLPDGLTGLEEQVAQLIRKQLHRGRLDVTVSLQVPRESTRRVVLDEALAQAYYEQLRALTHRLGLKEAVALEHVLALPSVVSVTDEPVARQTLWEDVRAVIELALRQLLGVRQAEGKRLVRDIRGQAAHMRRALKAIRARLPQSAAEQKRRLRQRLVEVAGKPPGIAARVQEALAVIRDTDVNEELVRLDSHLAHLEQTLAGGVDVGKKLDFIAQELTREANTLGAKANDGIIARRVVELKGAIEKIREQAQNLE